MKSFIALIFVGLAACACAGHLGFYGYSAGVPLVQAPLAVPYALTHTSYNTLASNYQLQLDTTLPGSAYASYPYAAAPTAYGYGVYKAL